MEKELSTNRVKVELYETEEAKLAEQMLVAVRAAKVLNDEENGKVTVTVEYTRRPITDSIKTVDEALEATGRMYAIATELQERFSKRTRALWELEAIAEALNEGWKPDFKDDEKKRYIPRFSIEHGKFEFLAVLEVDEEVDNSDAICFESYELAEYAGRQFTSVFERFIKGGRSDEEDR